MKKMLTSSKLAILWGRTFHVHLLSHATAQGRYMKTRRHLQNRKYITYRNAARGAVILSRAACMRKNLVLSYAMWFSSYVQASRQNISHLSRGQINSSFGVMPTAAESLMKWCWVWCYRWCWFAGTSRIRSWRRATWPASSSSGLSTTAAGPLSSSTTAAARYIADRSPPCSPAQL